MDTNPGQSEASSSPEPSTSGDRVLREDYEDEETLHGEISNPPSPLGGRIQGYPRHPSDYDLISSSTGVVRRPPSSHEEQLIDSTVDSSGMSMVTVPPPVEDEYCQSSSVYPPVSTSQALFSINDGISTTSGQDPESRKRCHEGDCSSSNGISSSNDNPIPSTSSGITTQSSDVSSEGLNIGQAFSGIPQSLLLKSPEPRQNGGVTTTTSHSSILESLSGPLSKRLRTLHNLQQRQQDPNEASSASSPPQSIEEHSGDPSQSSHDIDSSGPSNSSDSNNNDPSSSSGGSNNEEEPLPGPSYLGGTQQTFSVTLENSLFRKKSVLADILLDEDEVDLNDDYDDELWEVGSKARASLPEDLLFFKDNEEGVYAKKEIIEGYRFGPLEGQLVKPVADPSDKILLLIHKDKSDENEENGGSRQVNISDENQSNWLRFVRPASTFSEQNLSLNQEGERLFFTCTKVISPGQELRVWYSPDYAQSRKLPMLEPPQHSAESVSPNNEDNPWPCFKCNNRFRSSMDLQKHLNHHEGSLPKRFKSRRSYQRHCRFLTQKPLNRQHKCPICLRVFDRPYTLRRHVAFHSKKRKYYCAECNIKFSHPYNLNRHIRKAHCERKASVNCRTCGLKFSLESVRSLHALCHSDGGSSSSLSSNERDSSNLQCPQCETKCESWPELLKHSTSHGVKDPEEGKENIADNTRDGVTKTASGKGHKCGQCYRAFSSEERLARHSAVHGSDETKPVVCLECGKRFLSNSALACHAKIHSAEKRSFDCPICGSLFEQVIQLKEHIHVHRIDGRYTCPRCSKIFTEYALIRKHIRAFHSEKKFPCPHCDKSFTGADKLKVHLVKHSDAREFLCNECGKQFKRKDKLKDHSRRMHPPAKVISKNNNDKHIPPKQVSAIDYRRFVYKCHECLLGFKRRGMLVNHLAKRHPAISLQSVPELNLPILKATRNYYCQYCNKVYKSSSKRKSHILKNHPGAELPVSVRDKTASVCSSPGENPTYSAMVGSITSQPHSCQYCHKQYASKAKLLQHHRKKHGDVNPPPSHNKFKKSTLTTSQPGGICDYSIEAGRIIQLHRMESPETYHLPSGGVSFIPLSSPQNEHGEGPSNINASELVTLEAASIESEHLIVEAPANLEPAQIEQLINAAQLQVEHSSWMSQRLKKKEKSVFCAKPI